MLLHAEHIVGAATEELSKVYQRLKTGLLEPPLPVADRYLRHIHVLGYVSLIIAVGYALLS